MKSTEQIIPARDARQDAAVARANNIVELQEEVFNDTFAKLTSTDSAEFRRMAENSSRVSLQLAYLLTELIDPTLGMMMTPDERFEQGVRGLEELKALADDLGEVIIEIAAGAGVIPEIVRSKSGKIDYGATLGPLDYPSPFDVAQLVLDRFQAAQV